MCRIFGFRSVIKSQVHHSLISADNAIHNQSENHPDGWGVAYYVDSSPHVIKSEKTAIQDHLFKRVSGIVNSQTVIAHIRNATSGQQNILNTHPFQYGQWVFAHNGNIKNFSTTKNKLHGLVNPHLFKYILGDTDSEILFYILLTELQKIQNLTDLCTLNNLFEMNTKAIEKITKIIGPCLNQDDGPINENYLTYILTNGQVFFAYQGGKQLYYSTHKSKCKERNSCPFFAEECENPTLNGKVNHLLFSSEPIQGDNVWLPMTFGQSLGVDNQMILGISS
ncbi:MAG: class II glutamine amidotransferase [Bdellovibrionales bacterium]|nr:class II glutamine amidotransferase [Bdellovibrionales bacterium]